MTVFFPLGSGTMRAKLFGGIGQNAFLTDQGPIEMDLNPILGGRLSWETEKLQLGMAIASVGFDSSLEMIDELQTALEIASISGWPEAAEISNDIEFNGEKGLYSAVFASYDSPPWIILSELNYIDSSYSVFTTSISSYISVGRRFGPVTVYGTGAIAWSDSRKIIESAPPDWQMLQGYVQELYDQGTEMNQHTLSLGTRWDMRQDLALKLQWDHTWIDAYGGSLWMQRETLTEDRRLDTVSVNLSFVF
jgi:hypothetical protein